MSIAEEIFSEQDWSKFHKDILIKGLSDDKIESYCDYMLTEFNSAFDGHLYECQVDLLLIYNRSVSYTKTLDSIRQKRVELEALQSEYNELVCLFLFQYHTTGWASVDILAVNDGQVQKWLQDLLIGVNNSGDWGKYELYELSETRSILNDILFSEETGEYLQEKTATEEELKMIDELESIYDEKEELRHQHRGDDKHLLELQQAYHDWRGAVEQMHKRINYVDVQNDIEIPAGRILKGYALNARLDFDIESVQTSVLKINHWFNNNNTEKYQGKKSFLSWVNGAENKD